MSSIDYTYNNNINFDVDIYCSKEFNDTRNIRKYTDKHYNYKDKVDDDDSSDDDSEVQGGMLDKRVLDNMFETLSRKEQQELLTFIQGHKIYESVLNDIRAKLELSSTKMNFEYFFKKFFWYKHRFSLSEMVNITGHFNKWLEYKQRCMRSKGKKKMKALDYKYFNA